MPYGSQQIVQKLWNYCNVLRDDGLSYGDYIEQLSLLFLKMADELKRIDPKNAPHIPESYEWTDLLAVEGAARAKRSAANCSTNVTFTPCCACLPASFTRRVSRPTSSSSIASPPASTPSTKTLWIYDFRTNQHFTLKTNPLQRSDLNDFVACYHPKNRHDRKPTDRFRPFTYDELLKRDKVNLDIFWLKDESLEDSANLPEPGVIAAEIAEDLEAALDQFSQIAADLKKSS